MSSTGAITPALLHIRSVLAAMLNPFGWKVSTAENPLQKFNALSAVGSGGACVVSWAGDRKLDQAGRSLAEPVHYDGRPETEALKRRYAEWLAAG